MSSLRAQHSIPFHQVQRAKPCPRTAILWSEIFCFARERGALVEEHPNQSLGQNASPGPHMHASLRMWYASALWHSRQQAALSRLQTARRSSASSTDVQGRCAGFGISSPYCDFSFLSQFLLSLYFISILTCSGVQISILQASHSLKR